MPDRSKVRFQTKADTGLTLCAVVEVRFWDAFAHQMGLCKWASDGVTPKEDPHLWKKCKLESAQWKGPDTVSTACQRRGNRSNEITWAWHQGQLKERAGFLVSRSMTLIFRSTVGGRRHFPTAKTQASWSAKDISNQAHTLRNHFVLLKLSYWAAEAIVVEGKIMLDLY